MPRSLKQHIVRAVSSTMLLYGFLPMIIFDDLEKDCLDLAAQLVKIPSLTPVSPELRAAAALAIDCVQSFLQQSGAHCHRLVFQGGHERWDYPVDNLFAEWDGDDDLGHLCFAGHIDVVPAGDLRLWSCDPFCGTIRDGFLWGRGATDMKGAVAAFCAAGAAFAKGSAQPRPKLSLIITADEEWAAVNGTKKVLDWMLASGRRPSAFLIGEPSSPEEVGSHIKIGRRGSLCGTVRAKGVQGHAAYPDLFENPNRALALALAVLHFHRWEDSFEGMPPTAFEAVALESGDFNATAIIPGEAQALWNIRFTPEQNVETLLFKLRNLLEDLPMWARDHHDSASLKDITIIGNTGTASMPYHSLPSSFACLVSNALASANGRPPVLDAEGGTTDGRFVHAVFPEAQIVELGLPENGGRDSKARLPGGMHQADERCSVADLNLLTRCYASILSAFGSPVS
jgi:succinyl-diaminopimelate desuccinylase